MVRWKYRMAIGSRWLAIRRAARSRCNRRSPARAPHKHLLNTTRPVRPPPATAMPNAELLYLLQGDPAELAETLAGMRPADIAEALRDLVPAAAAKVVAVMPFDLAVQVFDEPELDGRYAIIQSMEPGAAAALIEAMSA